MSRCGSKHRWSRPSPGLPEPPQVQGIHVYLFWTREGERYLSHTSGEVTAEELCISAAEAVGITPVYHVLFALYNPLSRCWYNPNHIFNPEESSLILHYCMRFYFRNWHGLNDKEPTVSRYGLHSGTDERCSPLLEMSSLEYLFSQAKYEFVNEVVPMEEVQSEEELTQFKNECFGMAVLHLSHLAVQKVCTLQEIADNISYLSCIPRSFAKHISKENFVTKFRIRRGFHDFVKTFQHHTVDQGRLCSQEIMYKYISTLEHLVPRFATETFPVSHLQIRKDGSGSSSYSNTNLVQGVSKDNISGLVTHEILVSGTKGIQWREVSGQKVQGNTYIRNDYMNYMKKTKQQSSQTNENAAHKWSSFCDFPEITHIAITGVNVCISTQDSLCMEVKMNSSQEARSFISLLDGYYRLTADAHHYFCYEVAPPRIVLSAENRLHGPILDEFVLQKLKKEEKGEGAFLVRWSALDYRRIILAVLHKNKNGILQSHKQFLIQHKGSSFCLEGLDKEFSSLKELTDVLKTFVLKSGEENFSVKKCCLPRSTDISNLLVRRHGTDNHRVHNDSFSINLTELRFHQIKDRKIIQDQHLGRGTRTNIYSGWLQSLDARDNEEEESNNNFTDPRGMRVVLKILDQSHKDIVFAFFENASLMSKVSHIHLVYVHGISVRGSENIMVEEFVEFGPLDVFLRRTKTLVTPQWKFIVAIQLASALSYLENKRLVHGNICARNILVARPGMDGTTPFVKLSDPGIALNVLSREERLERIPWIAPECVDSGALMGNSADQWSFGVTLLEICNNGDLPMSGSTLSEKERFYQRRGRLAEPSSQELASFISKCLNYEAVERPSFLCVLRELTEIRNRNLDMSPSENLPDMNSSVYHKRYLKKMRDLGEGHFGKVTLYMYDPANDGTGELVAVKCLKQENGLVPDGWMKEIEILKLLDHTNIVQYKGCCTEFGGQVVQLIMEYLPLRSLREYLPKHKLGMPQCLLFAQQICQGMEYLHSKRYIHRDLAARNVLVENDSLVKIGDFGLSKYIREGENYYRVHEDGDSPVFWYAVECLKESKFSFSSDVWSFGVTLYEILTRCDHGQSPPTKFFEMMGKVQGQMTMVGLIELLEQKKRLPCPKECPYEVKSLMEECWDADTTRRPSFTSLIKRIETVCQTYQWQPNINFSLAQIC
ncbi:non-receptor tyrosine-protein kinase TYK2 [Thalassophryne amazonica]|uniref:non-receptor tyrosine-protein kinase TYK2 n=1 Tax=Thalassophryne amazonica TaxID=390379 RepID=UPI001471C00C|nr:non-receptor tyrosine-protein kinase TYK2 [Thalassophryne amazonica]XP_034045555.1 non-receptor tyrosine-protein kinase TYK2 [Thalassophryne amazonica]XP_034045556.1 non-receptor tyrosine-protein kinase TYK2 [Thalassophryne amazonica]